MCIQGKCHCRGQFTGDDCSVDKMANTSVTLPHKKMRSLINFKQIEDEFLSFVQINETLLQKKSNKSNDTTPVSKRDYENIRLDSNSMITLVRF